MTIFLSEVSSFGNAWVFTSASLLRQKGYGVQHH
jgi:hypothetical protein